jgi:hypothetical protein
MEFKFNTHKGSIYNNEIVEMTGDYTGPDVMTVWVNDDTNKMHFHPVSSETHTDVEVTLSSSNPNHIIVMDLLGGSPWRTNSTETQWVINVDGFFVKQYHKNSPASALSTNDLIYNFDTETFDLTPMPGLASIDEQIEWLNHEKTTVTHRLANELFHSEEEKTQFEVDLVMINKLLTETPPSGIDIRDCVISM